MPFLDGKPVIITKRNVDEYGNPVSVKQIETKQVVDIHNSIPLNYCIDRNHPIVINGLYQIYNKDEISENAFWADYDQGILFFHPSKVGQSLTITYMGTGYILISSNRIYRYNKVDGTSSSTSIEASFEKIENILNTFIQGDGTIDATTTEVIAARTDVDGQTYPSLGSRLDDITAQLNNLTTIIRYSDTVNITTTTKTISISIDKYNPERDGLSVYLSGVRMIENVDYTLDKTTKSITCVPGSWDNGDQIYFEVLQKQNDDTITGGGSGGTSSTINSSNVILTTPVFSSNNAQAAFIQIQTLMDDKVNQKDLDAYLPLAGGNIEGSLEVNGSTIVKTMAKTDSSTNAASTEFVRNNIGVLSGLTTTNKTDLVTAINEVNAKSGSVNLQEVIDARTDVDNQVFPTLSARLNSMQTRVNNTVTIDSLNKYLPLTGGIITGNLTINGAAKAPTVASTDNSTNIATTAFIKSLIGGELSALQTNDKTSLIAAINELNTKIDSIQKDTSTYLRFSRVVNLADITEQYLLE